MVALTPHADGWIVPVRAQPGARKNAVLGEHAGALKVAVTAPPVDGKANQAILAVLREFLGLKRSQLELVGGSMGRDKRYLVRGLSRADLEQRLAQLVE